MSYLLTHSLLQSWLYSMKPNPYEDMESEDNAREDFLRVLRREPSPTSEAAQNGIDFEDFVTRLVYNDSSADILKWHESAEKVANIIRGGQLQHKASQIIRIGDMDILLYGRLDALKAGYIYDIKFSKGYERGKYVASTQHPMYMKLIPEARSFIYLVSDGNNVWTEEYRRDETQDIEPIIYDFMDWLNVTDLMPLYKEHWKSK